MNHDKEQLEVQSEGLSDFKFIEMLKKKSVSWCNGNSKWLMQNTAWLMPSNTPTQWASPSGLYLIVKFIHFSQMNNGYL